MAEKRTHKPTIGLLGAPGSGKSFVARLFARQGCAVIDADVLAKQALEEPAVKRQLVEWWGEGVLDDAGRVDRKAVGRIVFADKTELGRLEGLTHPRVRERRAALRRQHERDPQVVAIVEDSPLLMEMGLAGQCDVLVYVDAPRPVREQRVAEERGWSTEELARREKMQASLDIKQKRADYMVNNHAGEAETLSQVHRVLSQILQRRF